jgi:FkbM family methyltransferase
MLVEYDGFHLDLFDADAISQDVAKGVAWEPHLVAFMRAFITRGMNCVDVGANFGVHTLEMARLTDGTVFAFEPQPEHFQRLMRNVELNGMTNVMTFNSALGDSTKMVNAPLFHPTELTGRHNLGDVSIDRPTHLPTVRVCCVTLDSVLVDTPIDFVKIDVQGYELFALDGMTQVIAKCFPTMVVEFEDHQLAKFGLDGAALHARLRSLGYTIILLDYVYPSDHVCVHESRLGAFLDKFRDRIVLRAGRNDVCPSVSHLVTHKLVSARS